MASEDYVSVRRLQRFYDKLKVWLFKNYAPKSYVDSVANGLETALDTLNDTMESVAHAGMYDLGTKTIRAEVRRLPARN